MWDPERSLSSLLGVERKWPDQSPIDQRLMAPGYCRQLKEQAGWLVGAPDLRPYDCPAWRNSSSPWMGIDTAVADLTRHSYLSNGQHYFRKAAGAARYVHKKQARYSRMRTQFNVRYLVGYTPLVF